LRFRVHPHAAEEVRLGFKVNRLDIRSDVIEAAAFAMDPQGSGHIAFEPFVCCMYALSIQSRKVRSAAKYAVFPDSDFTVETASAEFRVRRVIWTVSASGGRLEREVS
jgi:hypothetical protein